MKIIGINLYQIAVAIIAVIMIFQGLKRYLKGEEGQTFLKLFLRVIVWGGMALVAVHPKITYSLAKTIGITDNVNAVVLIGFILMFLIIFKLLSAIERLEQKFSEIVRKDALKDLNRENSNKTDE